MNIDSLEKIGLTKGEIRVYTALLELGECTKTLLAKKAGIAPSNIYDVTNRLVNKGIISKVEKNGIAHFSAANPHQLKEYLEEKQREIQHEQDIVEKLLPSLLANFERVKESTAVEVFNGWNGLKTVLSDLVKELNKCEENFVFGAGLGANPAQADVFFLKHSKMRDERGILTKIIFNEEVRKRKERITFFLKSKNCEVRFLNQSTPTEIIIYKNTTCMLVLVENPLVIRIRGKAIFDSFKQYCEILWKSARK